MKKIFLIIFLLSKANVYSQTHKITAQDYYKASERNVDNHQYDSAIVNLTSAINITPLTIFYYNRGLNYYGTNQYKNAVNDFDRVLLTEPGNYEAFFFIGQCYQRLKRDDLAIQNFSSSIAMKSTENALYGGALSYRQLKKYDLAIKDYQALLNIDSKNADTYYELGYCQEEKDDDINAIKSYTISLNLEPSNPNAYVNRGACYANLKQYDLAIKDFTAALKIDPTLEVAKENKARCLQEIVYPNR